MKIVFCVALAAIVSVSLACSKGGSALENKAANGSSANKEANTSKSPSAAPPTASSRKVDMTATADAISKEFKADSKSFDKYKGKVVEISGKFRKRSGTESEPEVIFQTTDSTYAVSCRLDPSALQAAAKLAEGDDLKMTGIGFQNALIGPIFTNCQMAP